MQFKSTILRGRLLRRIVQLQGKGFIEVESLLELSRVLNGLKASQCVLLGMDFDKAKEMDKVKLNGIWLKLRVRDDGSMEYLINC